MNFEFTSNFVLFTHALRIKSKHFSWSPRRNLLSNKDCQTNEPYEAMALVTEKEQTFEVSSLEKTDSITPKSHMKNAVVDLLVCVGIEEVFLFVCDGYVVPSVN